MVREDPKELSDAKRAYRSAAEEGNRGEEARWANVIGNFYKNRGEFANSLKWLRIDYKISSDFLSPAQCFAACQSLGESYLLLKDFQNALFYQKKHLELAKDEDNLVEQQRASTQLGRTYHDMLLHDKDDHSSVRSAKKYFKNALKLARTLKENPPTYDCSFLREYIDAHNNMGMLEIDLDNFEEAEKFLAKGLDICTEEEFPENDATRTRLHHNIGVVYMHLRMWDKAKKHMQTDIKICNRIGHCEGEAKGYINYGLLNYKMFKYVEARECYKRASKLAKTMEGNDSLLEEIDQNTESAKEAKIIMDDLKKEEQNLKKLTRDVTNATGRPEERKCLLQLNVFLDNLIEKVRMIEFWPKLRELGKRKKKITAELCDKEKLSESYLILGEAYSNLRNFGKASKWYHKSWDIYHSIGNLEEQARTKIEIGNVLDSNGDWKNALEAYEESYRIAVEAKLPSVQLSALENMQYCHLIRFSNDDEARILQLEIDKLKKSKDTDFKNHDEAENCCSETDSEGSFRILEDKYDGCGSADLADEEVNGHSPSSSLLHSTRSSSRLKPNHKGKQKKTNGSSPKGSSKSACSNQTVGYKRSRLVLSDSEDETRVEVEDLTGRAQGNPVEDVGTSDEFKYGSNTASPICVIEDDSAIASKSTTRIYTRSLVEESSTSYKTTGPNGASQNGKTFESASTEEHDYITVKIDNELIHVKASLFDSDTLSMDCVKAEMACLFYLQLVEEKKSAGLLPIIHHIKFGDREIESLETFKIIRHDMGEALVEASVDGWVQRRLIKHYIDGCKEQLETPNMKLLKKLYDLEVSDDEINISNCELQDLSVTPLLNALYAHKTFSMLDLSHNLLGNGTMEKLREVFTSSSQKYGGLTLDLHCNLFGPTALIQICECPSLFSRLEVLNISGNRITDSSATCLSTILKKCQALCSLNIEGCAITTRTILKVLNDLDSESVLEQLYIGHNNPIAANAIINLLQKLATLKRFSKLSLNGLKLSKAVVDGLCVLSKNSSSFSSLMLGETSIGNESASLITETLFDRAEESVKLDFSYCKLTSDYVVKLNADPSRICCILELNLAGNPIGLEGINALSLLLMNPQCCLKVLVLEKCQLGVGGILQTLQALAENTSLEDLNLADNSDIDQHRTPKSTSKVSLEQLQPMSKTPELSHKSEESKPDQQGLCPMEDDLDQLEVADSEDQTRAEATASVIDDTCDSLSQKNSSSHENQFNLEIFAAISNAKMLQYLDLSNNGFSSRVAETMFTVWSSSRPCPAYRHLKDRTIHLLAKGRKCCIKPCCKKD